LLFVIIILYSLHEYVTKMNNEKNDSAEGSKILLDMEMWK